MKRFESTLWVGLLIVGAVSAACAASACFAQESVDMQYVPGDAAAVAVAHPRELMMMPAMELLPREIFSATTIKEIGVDIMEVTQIAAFAMTPQGGPVPPDYGLVVRFRDAAPMPRVPGEKIEIAGRPGIQLPGPMAPAVITAPDGKTLLVGPANFLPKILDAQGPEGVIGTIVDRASRAGPGAVVAVVDVQKLRPLINPQLQNAPPLPPQLQDLLKLPNQVDALAILADMKNETTHLLFRCTNEDEAGNARESIIAGLAFGKQLAMGQVAQEIQKEQDPIMQQAMMAYANRVGDVLQKQLTPIQTKNDLRLTADANFATVGVLTALLLPAVQAAREAARRAQSVNILRQLSLAMHNYHDTHKQFPARYSEAGGKPGLSWRVHLLPYLGQEQLYRQFHLDEPWDSEHNRTLIGQMPGIYRNPNRAEDDGKTVFLAANGEGVLMEDTKSVSLADLKDGTANTIMFVEANLENAVIWTKPDDLPYDSKQPMRGLGKLRPGGFQAGMADGSVHFIANTIDQDVLRAMFTRAGGEIVRIP